ncbi:ABC transporter permease subunit [Kribbella sp. DT2]|uniref:ABC transporter permease subunit n=1 Tax=Kribbella sp. DT2 TaxID=3393427 RepID=UPI003CF8CA5D
MKQLIRGEITRLFATRLPRWAALAAVGCGAGLTGLLAFIGPEHASPPMPGIDTPEGVGIVVGITGVLLFVPALLGTIAVTGEYRHRTIGTTFLAVPRRGRVLRAKLVVYGVFGLAYGVTASLASGIALTAAVLARGVDLPVSVGSLVTLLLQLAIAAAVYMVLGVGIGALARNQLLAIGIVLGYFYFLEYVLMILPGVNVIYPFLPGGATASLTSFTFLSSTIADQNSLGTPTLLPAAAGALILAGYAAAAAGIATLVPLRRDLS